MNQEIKIIDHNINVCKEAERLYWAGLKEESKKYFEENYIET